MCVRFLVTIQNSRFHGYYLWVCPDIANENGILARSTNTLIAVLNGKLEPHDRSGYVTLRVHYRDCRIAIHPKTSLWPALIVGFDIVDDEAFVNPSIVKVVNFIRVKGGLGSRIVVIAGR